MKRTLAALTLALLGLHAFAAPAELDQAIADITHQWAKVNYQIAPAQQAEGYKALIATTEQVSAAWPGKAEPLIWQAIALSSAAKVEGGLSALGKVKQARELLLGAEKIDPNALAGSVYTSLGSLYAKVPGWPLAFGDKAKAEQYLKHALALNPNGLDANFFFGELLADEGRYAQAADHLKRALAAPARAGREDSDAGRRAEAQTALDTLRSKHGDQLAAQ